VTEMCPMARSGKATGDAASTSHEREADCGVDLDAGSTSPHERGPV
jgi:hypothetical protein